jgi:hypothetical protein
MNDQVADVPREEPIQPQLLHYSPQQVCDELGLNWLSAVRLFHAGWLSFDPALVAELDEGQEIELRFLGALAAAGCDDRMLAVLLAPLRKPYLYCLTRIYYDLHQRTWVALPRLAERREDLLHQWVDELMAARDGRTLRDLRFTVDKALAAVEENPAAELSGWEGDDFRIP